MAERIWGIKATVGFSSERGPRSCNDDFAGAVVGAELPEPRRDVIAAIADGIASAKGGRVAAETAVRGFLDGMCEMPETTEVRRSAAQVLNSLSAWMHSQGRRDSNLAGMGCTFTGLVLRGRIAHVLHAGDTRAYRLSANRLSCLTTDHAHVDSARGSGVLYRALGVEPEVRLEYIAQPMARHDRFLLCSDGVHGWLTDESIADILRDRCAPADTAKALVAAALESGGADNSTALVLDVSELPTAVAADFDAAIMQLPIVPVPLTGDTIDGFVLKALLSEGRYTRLFAAVDEIEGGDVALKFPKPKVADADAYRRAFAREARAAARVDSPWLGRIIELPQGRQTSLYTVMPLYQGELLETRIARRPSLGLEEGRQIAIRLARAAAALHRKGIIHRDIKPDNVILEGDGSLKLIDLGVVRVPGLEDAPPEEVPGTRAYMAPEMLAGEPGNEATDVYALGVTMFNAFTGGFPYGNADAVGEPTRARPQELGALRPDLPSWLQDALSRAMALDPTQRFRDMSEFALEMESGPGRAPPAPRRPRTLYERAPLRFWKCLAALLALALIASLLWR